MRLKGKLNAPSKLCNNKQGTIYNQRLSFYDMKQEVIMRDQGPASVASLFIIQYFSQPIRCHVSHTAASQVTLCLMNVHDVFRSKNTICTQSGAII